MIEPAENVAASTRNEAILVVDDDPVSVRLIAAVLERSGYRVRSADSGARALESVRDCPPAMILLDVRMQDIDGYEVCRRLKADEATRAIPILFISALEEETDKLRGFEAGGIDYVTKPFRVAEVLARVQTHMDLLRAVDDVRRSESLYRTLVDNLSIGVSMTGSDMRVRAVNRRIVEWFPEIDFSACPVCFQVLRQASEPCAGCPTVRTIEDGQVHDAVIVHPGPSGERHFRVTAMPVFDAHGRVECAIETIDDITAQVNAERDRKAGEARLRQQQKLEAIGTLASGVAHEINNPLNIIMNYAQLIAEDGGDPEQTRSFAASIITESERLAGLVRNLLQFSRQESQGLSHARIEDIVEATLGLVRTLLRKSRNPVVVDVPEGLPAIRCKPQQIQQVLLNLVTNARDALADLAAGADVDRSIRISAREVPRDGARIVRITVADQGGGIPPDVAARVFDPFFTTKAREQGTGLGLSISHGIVRDHGGELWFETEAGRGTRFHVDLPAGGPPA